LEFGTMQEPVYVAPNQLAIGMFVILDLSWLEHPFAFNSFVVQTDAQLATLRSLALKRVRIDPLRSKMVVAPSPTGPAEARSANPPLVTATDSVAAEKAARIEQNRVLRSNIAHAEKHAAKAAQAVRQTTKQFFSEPAKAIAGTNALIKEATESLLGNSEVMVHLLNDKVAGEEVYYHSLNVAMLALLLGKAMEFDAAALQTVGVAAIFHDIGKEEIPSRVLLKTDPLTHAEEELLRQHCEAGAKLALRGAMPQEVVLAILQHHENLDGSGYPHHLAGDRITPATRVISVVNHYDNLCNPINVANAMTPYEALSTMFAKRKNWFDAAMLGKLVHVLGVYPPGSVVRLSSGATGMVISVNSARPLQPLVLVHDASIPKAEAIILDLEKTPEISISKALRPNTLAPSVYEYLSPRKRVTYYFGEENRGN
jgi:putative nucleotidyltransferase with HDIG domain